MLMVVFTLIGCGKQSQEAPVEQTGESIISQISKEVIGPSDEEVIRARMVGVEQLQQNLDEWQDAVKVAGATGRIALSGPVANLQAIRRKLDAIEVSDCLKEPKANLYQAYGGIINMFLGHMRKEETSEHDQLQVKAHMEAFAEKGRLCRMLPKEAEQKTATGNVTENETKESVERVTGEPETSTSLDEDSNERIKRIIEQKRKENPL
jgi:hypothetical protein